MPKQHANQSMADMPNHYQLLGLESKQTDFTLSAGEVKQAYRRALLQHHPDKTATNAKASGVTVDDIALAYKTLADAGLRGEYDAWLQSLVNNGDSSTPRPRHTGLETIDLDDLDYDATAEIWSRGCRCGDAKGFTLSERGLEEQADEGEIIVGCKGCSLWLRVLFGVEG
jgi:diphthamide biosynthesis protein 4